MTERLYYDQPYLTQFEAAVVERTEFEGKPAVVLDRTAFYPLGGGQPPDRGLLNGVPVVDAIARPEDGAVLHVLGGELREEAVRGEIDWERRFDHMQQHSGQHILSQACLQIAKAETVGFHLSRTYATIDVNASALTDEALHRAEALANQIIFEDRRISARFVDPADLDGIPLRRPPQVSGPVRVVEVHDFDWSACGGTHVASAGVVGLIKIIKTERRNQQTRLTFLCGGRALAHYADLNAMARDLAGALSVAVEDLPEAVARLQNDLRDIRKERDRLQELLLDHEAVSLLTGAETVHGVSVVRRHFKERDLEQVRRLATRIAAQPGHVALLGVIAGKGQLVFARSRDVNLDLRPVLQAACRLIGGGGGGGPDLAQGGGPDGDQVPAALEAAEALLRRRIAGAEDA
ncbi:MAG: DHHA1 domain-containing protein [Anaerolineae bacterium]